MNTNLIKKERIVCGAKQLAKGICSVGCHDARPGWQLGLHRVNNTAELQSGQQWYICAVGMLYCKFFSSELLVRLLCVPVFSKGMAHLMRLFQLLNTRQQLGCLSVLFIEPRKGGRNKCWRQNPSTMSKREQISFKSFLLLHLVSQNANLGKPRQIPLGEHNRELGKGPE